MSPRPPSGGPGRQVRQRTIRERVSVAGEGIHSGRRSVVTLVPAPIDHGIVFVRTDRPQSAEVRASAEAVIDTRRGVTLGPRDAPVRTIEHLLAAAAGLGITNLVVEVAGEELPVLDGSAGPYCLLLQRAGIEEQPAVAHPLILPHPLWVGHEGASVFIVPAAVLRITYAVPLDHPVLGPVVVADVELKGETFTREVAPARTWGFAADVEKLRAQGLAAGATLDRALGIGPAGYMSPPRLPDEPARHKILDLVGDLALLGRPVVGHCVAVGAGHALHLELVRALQTAGAPERS